MDGNLVFEKSDDATNGGFLTAFACKVYLTRGVHIIKNRWRNTNANSAWGTVTEVYDCSFDELKYDYPTIEEAEAHLSQFRIFSTGDFFTDVNADGKTATGILPNRSISDADVAAGWEPAIKNGQIVAARKTSEGNSGFQMAKYLKVFNLENEPIDAAGEKCSESGQPQATVINAGVYVGKPVGTLLTIGGVTCQVSDIFEVPDDLYTNAYYRTHPVKYRQTPVIIYNSTECPL